jgi:hypothetical protein
MIIDSAKAARFFAISGAFRTLIARPAIAVLLNHCIANLSVHIMIADECSIGSSPRAWPEICDFPY